MHRLSTLKPLGSTPRIPLRRTVHAVVHPCNFAPLDKALMLEATSGGAQPIRSAEERALLADSRSLGWSEYEAGNTPLC